MAAVKLRDLIRRTFVILLAGGLIFTPLAVSAAGMPSVEVQASEANAHAHHMAMDAMAGAMDETPCHKNSPNKSKACPFMAICMMLCCQGIPVANVLVPALSLTASRVLPPAFSQPDGVASSPPSRPPKA